LANIIYDLAPVEALAGKLLTSGEIDSRTRQGKQVIAWGNACIVSYRVACRFGAQKSDHVILQGYNYFPGSLDDFRREFATRIDALIARTPLPENIRGPRISVGGGVSDELLCRAFQRLGVSHYAPELQETYYQKRKEIFDNYLWPTISQRADGDYARNRDKAVKKFGELADSSFRDMRENGRGGNPPPKARNRKKVNL